MGKLIDHANTQNIEGDNNFMTQSGNINPTIINNYTGILSHCVPSAIEKVLGAAISIAESSASIKFEPLDTKPFDLTNKIDYNEIAQFKEHLEDLLTTRTQIKKIIDELSETDVGIQEKLIKYVKDTYISSCNKEGTKSDAIIESMRESIRKDLQERFSDLDGMAYIRDIIFYVFAECRIFKKPPEGLYDS